jgi:hypothetical protein
MDQPFLVDRVDGYTFSPNTPQKQALASKVGWDML